MARTGYDFQSPDMKNAIGKEARAMSKEIIQFDQAMFETKLDAMVRDKVEQIVNAMLDEEADLIANAARYERSDGRKAYRAGHYARGFTVKAGRLGLKVPKLKGALFESAAVERYRRREQSVEESLIDMYLAGVSTRRVDDISQLLWGERMPSQTLSDKLRKVYDQIDERRNRPLDSEYPYVFMDGVRRQALMGRRSGERERAGRHRRGGGHEGGQGQPGAVHTVHDRARPEGRQARGRRQVRRARRHRRRDAAAGQIPAVHGPLHAQRALQGAAHPPRMGVRRARGDLRHGITRVRPRQGRGGRPRDGVQETESGGLLPEGRYRRDHDLAARRVSPGAPAADPHEQHDSDASTGRSAGAPGSSAAPPTAGARSCSSAPGSDTSPPTIGRADATWTCPDSVTPCRQPTETDPATGQTAFAQDSGHNRCPCPPSCPRRRRLPRGAPESTPMMTRALMFSTAPPPRSACATRRP